MKLTQFQLRAPLAGKSYPSTYRPERKDQQQGSYTPAVHSCLVSVNFPCPQEYLICPLPRTCRKSVEFIEAEIGDNVEQISSIVRNLNRVAKDMEGELISSNVQLDVINAKVIPDSHHVT